MKDLILLFVIYGFFIVASIMIGAGVYLIDRTYAFEVTGTLLILSTFAVIWQFFKEFGDK